MAEPPRDLNRSSDGDKAPARRGGRALPGPLKRLLTGRVSVQPFGASRGLSVPHIGERFRDDRVAGVGWRTLSACRTWAGGWSEIRCQWDRVPGRGVRVLSRRWWKFEGGVISR